MTDPRDITTCRICDGPVQTVLDFGMQPMATGLQASADEQPEKYPLTLRLCSPCLHLQTGVMFDDKLPIDSWETEIYDGATIAMPYAGDLWNRGIFDWVMHERPSLMGLTALCTLAEKHGLKVESVSHFDMAGVKIAVRLAAGDVQMHDRYKELERQQRHDHPARWRQVQSRVDDHKNRIRRRLERATKEGRRNVAYGISAEGATVLGSVDIGSVECIISMSGAGMHWMGKPVVTKEEAAEFGTVLNLDWRNTELDWGCEVIHPFAA